MEEETVFIVTRLEFRGRHTRSTSELGSFAGQASAITDFSTIVKIFVNVFRVHVVAVFQEHSFCFFKILF